MRLSIVVQNTAQGALRDAWGNPEDRWPLIVQRIESIGEPPDLVLLQEAADWGRYGHRQLGRAMDDLNMDAMPIPPSHSGLPPVLLYRRETVGRWRNWNTDYAQETMHGFGAAIFDVGLPKPLAVISAHLNPFSPDKARAEAKLLATRAYRYGPYGIIGGDINYPPAAAEHPAPDYETMRPYNRSARTRLPSESGGTVVPDRRVAEMLAYSGFVDAAWHLYKKTGDKELLRRTGSDDRIDQLWVTAPLAEAITEYRLLDDPADASDHAGVMVRLDLSTADTDNPWDYR
ncbi:hypothetical protein ACH4UT_23350 [Streptomyces sp. NPDC020799]|uniref:hypothetical protein n=1 Tax=Streptomyces sp. NPDC020799 TaxID=3365091 RepID=UPI003787815B